MITMMDSSKKLVTTTFYCIFCGEPIGPGISPTRELAHERECRVPQLERMALPMPEAERIAARAALEREPFTPTPDLRART